MRFTSAQHLELQLPMNRACLVLKPQGDFGLDT